MKMTKKEKNILSKYFGIYENEYSNGLFYELEQWTDGGVDMVISIDSTETETITEQFESYINNFDIDEEIETYRQDADYKNSFTIRQSLEDFENWIIYCKNILKELKGGK